jgi:hypothetical protein
MRMTTADPVAFNPNSSPNGSSDDDQDEERD